MLPSKTLLAIPARIVTGAINKVMKQQPAVFLKLLVLLVPREMKVEHSGGVKAMTDEQLEAGIEAIQRMLEARAASEVAKVIDAVPEPVAIPAPSLSQGESVERRPSQRHRPDDSD